ncbi:MAG: hypothetical protein ACYC4L_02175 [Chloroflexota bacterium]
MLPKQHVVISSLAVVAAVPFMKDKSTLGLFWTAAVGQDVDHYLWHTLRFRTLSLRAAYRFFRGRYGRPWSESGESGNARALHGPVPLVAVFIASLRAPALRPVLTGMLFHGLLDALNEYILMPESGDRRTRSRLPAYQAVPTLDEARRVMQSGGR